MKKFLGLVPRLVSLLLLAQMLGEPKATNTIMPLEVLKKIARMKSPAELETVKPYNSVPAKANLIFAAGRSGGPGFGGGVNAWERVMGWRASSCRKRTHLPPDAPVSPENMKPRVDMGQCPLETPIEIGWEKVRRLAEAIADSGFPPRRFADPKWGKLAESTLPRDNRMGFSVELAGGSSYTEGIIWKYAVDCKPGDPKCEAIWKVAEEEFWFPVKTRYPWLPDVGAPEWHIWSYISDRTPEGKRYIETSPIIECYEYDIGKLTFRRECTPDSRWTEEDETKLKKAIARDEKAQKATPGSSGK